MTATCATCGADWENGRFTPDCRECGGGSMERSCIVCRGRCNAVFRRAVDDSHEAHVGHWVGTCALQPSRKRRFGKERPSPGMTILAESRRYAVAHEYE